MSRGITLYEREAIKLTKILARRLQLDNEEQADLFGERQMQYADHQQEAPRAEACGS